MPHWLTREMYKQGKMLAQACITLPSSGDRSPQKHNHLLRFWGKFIIIAVAMRFSGRENIGAIGHTFGSLLLRMG